MEFESDAVDPAQSNARLYLAQALDRQGELQAAARHYRVYLGIIAARQYWPGADADAAINHTADASKGYRAAAGFADKAGEKALSRASDWHNYAQFLRKQGQPGRYVFACLLDAENMLQTILGDELAVVSQARRESESSPGEGFIVSLSTLCTKSA